MVFIPFCIQIPAIHPSTPSPAESALLKATKDLNGAEPKEFERILR
jgi:hypothetical protein